jgi:hypothetical protein
VHNARLHHGRPEHGLDRLREAFKAVNARDEDVLDAALLEFLDRRPA